MTKLKLYSDGGARGNPGPSGIGAVLKNDNNEIIAEVSEFIGNGTNNQAEYRAVLAGMEKAKSLGVEELHCYLDSELVVKQLKREYKVKNVELATLFVKAHNLALNFKKITYTHIRRELNKEADLLANLAMDRGMGL